MSTEPATRSSVAFSGRLTMRTLRETTGSSSPPSRRSMHSAHGRAGSHEKGQSATTSISGSSAASPRTAVDLPVPLGPDDEHASDRRVDGVEQESRREALLLDDRGERIVCRSAQDQRLPECGLGLRDRVELPGADQGTAVSRLTRTSTTYGFPAARAVSSAAPRSLGSSTVTPPAPIASAIFTKSGFQNSPWTA